MRLTLADIWFTELSQCCSVEGQGKKKGVYAMSIEE